MPKSVPSLIFPCAAVLVLALGAAPAAAQHGREVSAYDPRLHVKPPTMVGTDGTARHLVLDDDFFQRAERHRRDNPRPMQLRPEVVQIGEVLVVQGDDSILTSDGVGFGLRNQGLEIVAARVVAKAGDHFQAITVWTTFEDRASPQAEAYEMTIKNDVQGLGPDMPVRDMSSRFGSNGVLRSLLNMKNVALRAGDSAQTWRIPLQTWGQESAHRWLVFLHFRDPRTGRPSDALLGRGCSHYSRFVDTQGSVHDGLSWRDNGDGTFTWVDREARYGNLDLYGMGLLHPDEVPSFFLIDDIPGYRYPASCREYPNMSVVPPRTVSGKRVDISIDDIIAANGPRLPTAEQPQDYQREAQVVLIAPNETPSTARVVALAERVNRARIFWEDWNREATSKRLVICTQTSADCGDPRSDVSAVIFNATGKAPNAGPVAVEIDVANGGTRAATGIKATLEATIGGTEVRKDVIDVPALEPGTAWRGGFSLDLKKVACGTRLDLKVSTQSDFHYSRHRTSELVGAEARFSDGFEAESGWTINPDGDDSAASARWERGTPERTDLVRRTVQAAGARTGQAAWATGLAAASRDGRATLVNSGKATLQSPAYDSSGLRDPALRYWVSFTGVRADGAGTGLEPSEQSQLLVQARSLDMPAGGGTASAPAAWVEVDRISNLITTSWIQRTVVLPVQLLRQNRLQFRFVAVDANPQSGAVEVALDDVEVTGNNPACYIAAPSPPGDAGCGCRVGTPARPAKGAALAVFVLVFAFGLRRRGRL